MDEMELKKKILDELIEHMQELQGEDLHSSMVDKMPAEGGKVSKVEMEVEPAKAGIDEKAEEAEEGDEMAAKGMGGDDEMSDDEIKELLEGLA